ncbi:hypothetical protein GCM10007905_13390 [Mixta theicola]|nr:hypothetical protein GCM10007905_13390 [Mixta theicola]
MGLQTRSQIAIQLNNGQRIKALADGFSQGAKAGPDLYHRLAALRMNSRNDAVDNVGVVKEVLPKTFTGEMTLVDAIIH